MDRLFEFYNRKLKEVPTDFFRNKYEEVKWTGRAFGLEGPTFIPYKG